MTNKPVCDDDSYVEKAEAIWIAVTLLNAHIDSLREFGKNTIAPKVFIWAIQDYTRERERINAAIARLQNNLVASLDKPGAITADALKNYITVVPKHLQSLFNATLAVAHRIRTEYIEPTHPSQKRLSEIIARIEAVMPEHAASVVARRAAIDFRASPDVPVMH